MSLKGLFASNIQKLILLKIVAVHMIIDVHQNVQRLKWATMYRHWVNVTYLLVEECSVVYGSVHYR